MSSRRIVLRDVIGVLLFIIVAEVLAYYSLSVLKIAPVSYTSLIEAGITILVGYIAITIIAKTIADFVTRISGPRKGNTASVTFRYVGYIVLALIVFFYVFKHRVKVYHDLIFRFHNRVSTTAYTSVLVQLGKSYFHL